MGFPDGVIFLDELVFQCNDMIKVLEEQVKEFMPGEPCLALLGVRGGLLKSNATFENQGVQDGDVIRILQNLPRPWVILFRRGESSGVFYNKHTAESTPFIK